MNAQPDDEAEKELARRVWHGAGHTIGGLPIGNPQSWAGSVQSQLLSFGPSPDLSARRAAPQPYPAVAAVTMVKDEADVIGQNLSSLHRLGVRRFVIVDNGSTDGTTSAIDVFVRRHEADTEVAIAHDDSVAYLQADKMTAACRHAISYWPDLEWVIPFDADEFLQSIDGLQALSSVPDDIDALTVQRVVHFRPPGSPDGLGIAGMNVRSTLFALPPKVVFRATDKLGLGKGNHWVDTLPGRTVRYAGGLHHGLFVREFQTRSFAQFLSKVRNGGLAVRAAQAAGRYVGCEHWLEWYAMLETGGETALRAEYANVAFRPVGGDYLHDEFDLVL